MQKKKLPTKTLRHLYESEGLYEAMYSRHLGYKMGEAGGFAHILQEEEVRPKKILELFAGPKSKHKDFFKLQYHYWDEVESYKALDGFASEEDDVIVADAGLGDYGEKFDAIFAYYYAVSSAVDPEDEAGRITWDYIQKLLANARKHLNPGGILIIDSAKDGYRLALSSVSDRDENTVEYDIDVPLGHPLREELKNEGVSIADKDDVTLRNTYTPVYDRMTANCEDWFKELRIEVNDKPRFVYNVEQPFCQHYFTEPEIIRMLQQAGFEDIDFWDLDYEDALYSKHDTIIHAEDCESDAEFDLMANVFVARAPK